MALINQGLFFLDFHATRDFKEKEKFIITLSNGENESDRLLCYSLNTERRMDLYTLGCNKKKAKYILSPIVYSFSFLKNFTSIKLDEPLIYTVQELYEPDNIKLLKDRADEKLLREIKNCIDTGYLTPPQVKMLKEAFNK